MTQSTTFFLTVNGLFDFDLTFATEALLFLVLSIVVTFVFLQPISNQLDERANFISYAIRKSSILLTFGYEKLYKCVGLLTDEIKEMNRQLKLVKNYTNLKFESEILFTQKENIKILSELKGDLTIKSAYLFSFLQKDIIILTNNFFDKRFKAE